MMDKVNDWGFDFWLHLIIITAFWVSPLFLSWWIILIMTGGYYLQLLIFGDCILSKKQFRTKKRSVTFYWYYGRKLFPELDMMKVRFCADWVFPYIILGVAIITQTIFGYRPLIF
ncbi:MAG: hypothetical protein AABW73_03890 [Nanoarchaeota archaeon]